MASISGNYFYCLPLRQILNQHIAKYRELLLTDRDPGPGKSQPFSSDYYPGPSNFQEETRINKDHF